MSDYSVSAGPNLLLMGLPAADKVPQLTVSRPAELGVMRQLRGKTACVIDPDFDRRRFDAVVGRFGAQKVWTSSAGSFELYRAALTPTPAAKGGQP